MKRIKHTVLAVVIALSTSACANLSTVYRAPDLTGAENRTLLQPRARSLVLDANQSVVLQGTPRKGDKENHTYNVFCAQPSPDAITAVAASGGLNAAFRDISAETAFALGQTTASIGLRTQSIQLLRDHSYRLCEGYLSGAIDEFNFRILQRRYQNLMTAVLAIEQLTGPVMAQQAAIGVHGDASAGASIRSLVDLRIDLTEKIAADEAALKEARDTAAADDDSEEKKQDEKDPGITAIEERLDSRRKGVAAIDTLMGNLEPGSASTHVVQALADLRQAASLDAASIKHVSKAVENISRLVLEADYTGQMCFDFLMQGGQSSGPANQGNDNLTKFCRDYFKSINSINALAVDIINEEKYKGLSNDERLELFRLLIGSRGQIRNANIKENEPDIFGGINHRIMIPIDPSF
ncbi:hypothetical protein F1654_08805 [Alkalicaulis satelles]|uniref:Uncharacterized protein n=1 Tax=Alkalicaulis satelles TaxID=2609175 RepID=A0A5M6ZGK3_9PROT|nr:hypothetical protein [Alkalicaulis satelles]KAA5803886.1 hypothetical protein F1654_08805 [Alkalicaulis satelles]